MSLANPGWGAPRIHGELLKLGFELSQATVAKYLVRHRRPPSQNWRTFLKNHMNAGQPSLPGSALYYTETLRRTPLVVPRSNYSRLCQTTSRTQTSM